jgi:hypothetical protein
MVSAREQLKRILGCPKKQVVPGIGRRLVGGEVAQAHDGAADVELRRTRLEHVQMRRGKAEANAGPATKGKAMQDNDVQGCHARRRRCEYGVANRKEKPRSEGSGRA